jgi:hypothetical protein
MFLLEDAQCTLADFRVLRSPAEEVGFKSLTMEH